MDGRYQQEPPNTRVNITLDIQTYGAQKRYELPLKLLILGDFTGLEKRCPLAKRQRVAIKPENFEQILTELSPGLEGVTEATLRFTAFKDFHPQQIVQQVPRLSRLLAMRNLLKDLKANLTGNRELSLILSKSLQDKLTRQGLSKELKNLNPKPR